MYLISDGGRCRGQNCPLSRTDSARPKLKPSRCYAPSSSSSGLPSCTISALVGVDVVRSRSSLFPSSASHLAAARRDWYLGEATPVDIQVVSGSGLPKLVSNECIAGDEVKQDGRASTPSFRSISQRSRGPI